jgi:hypothetical protein
MKDRKNRKDPGGLGMQSGKIMGSENRGAELRHDE